MAQYTFDTLLYFDIAKIVLPSGYTKLNYIENQGNASTYIDTNYVANANTTLRALVSVNTTEYNSMGYIGTYRYGFSLLPALFKAYIGMGEQPFSATIQTNTKYLIEIDNITKKVSLNNTLLGTIGTISYPIGGTYWIGRLNGYSYYFNGKIHYHEFLENGVSVQKLIPCEDGNGNIGKYDVVTDTFFANQGTNPFISGGTAPTITPIAGDTATVTDLGITLTSDGTDWYVTSNITLATLSQATQLFSFAKGDNGVRATVTDLGITLTSDGTDWYVTSNITLATISQATQLFAFAKGNNGVMATVTSTEGVYKYEGDDWQLWYTITPPLVFRGITFEQTEFWQIPEMVFRGFSFEGENILRYYGVKIDVNGETERNYISCIRTSDGIAGLYDTVNGVFYASAGADEFIT